LVAVRERMFSVSASYPLSIAKTRPWGEYTPISAEPGRDRRRTLPQGYFRPKGMSRARKAIFRDSGEPELVCLLAGECAAAEPGPDRVGGDAEIGRGDCQQAVGFLSVAGRRPVVTCRLS